MINEANAVPNISVLIDFVQKVSETVAPPNLSACLITAMVFK
jgi:hypothetical protein